jgi:hypothetical protein
MRIEILIIIFIASFGIAFLNYKKKSEGIKKEMNERIEKI